MIVNKRLNRALWFSGAQDYCEILQGQMLPPWLGEDTLNLLETEPVPWRLADCRGGGVKWMSMLGGHGLCRRRYTIDLALDPGLTELSEKMLTALKAFEEIISTTTRAVDFLTREGELLFSDNTRTLEARTPVTPGGSRRLMFRSRIRTS